MPTQRKLTKQFPWVGTETQDEVLTRAAEEANTSKAEVIREAVNYVFGLHNGRLPRDWSVEDAVAAGQALVQGPSPHRGKKTR